MNGVMKQDMEIESESRTSGQHSGQRSRVKSKRRQRSHKNANNRAVSANELSDEHPAKACPTSSPTSDKQTTKSKQNKHYKQSSSLQSAEGISMASSVVRTALDCPVPSKAADHPVVNTNVALASKDSLKATKKGSFGPNESSSREGAVRGGNAQLSSEQDVSGPGISSTALEGSDNNRAMMKPDSSCEVAGPCLVTVLGQVSTADGSTSSEVQASLPEKSTFPDTTETDSFSPIISRFGAGNTTPVTSCNAKKLNPQFENSQLCPEPISENMHHLESSGDALPSAKQEPLLSAHCHDVPNDHQLYQPKIPHANTHVDKYMKDESSAKYKHHRQLVSKMRTLRQIINDTSDKTAVAWEEIKAMKQKNEMAFKKDDVRTVITNKMRINVLKNTIKEAQSNQQKFYELYKTLREEVIASQWYQNSPRATANTSSRDVGRV